MRRGKRSPPYYKMRHLHNFVHGAHRDAVRMWTSARHYGRIVDRYVQGAAHIYGSAIQPGLRAAGVDTRDVDSTLLKSYDNYSQFKSNIDSGVRLGDNMAAHLRHYY